MARQAVGIGSAANDGNGDDLRAGATKINANFTEIYDAFGDGSALDTISGNVVGTTSTQTLTNKTLTAPALSGTVTGTYTIGGTVTFPAEVVRTAASQTLTNKTLTAPVLGGTVTGTYTIGGTPTFPSTVVLTTATQTLTNKTIAAGSNTITGLTAADIEVSVGLSVAQELQNLDGALDGVANDVAALQGATVTRDDFDIYQKIGTNASDARVVTGVNLDPTDIVIWTGYATRPANMGVNDIWQGPPGASVNAQNGTSYTFVLNDGGTVVTINNASAAVVMIPTNASVAFPIGTIINVYRRGAGSVALTGDTGVTVNGTSAGSVAISARWQGVAALKVGENEWIVSGAIA